MDAVNREVSLQQAVTDRLKQLRAAATLPLPDLDDPGDSLEI